MVDFTCHFWAVIDERPFMYGRVPRWLARRAAAHCLVPPAALGGGGNASLRASVASPRHAAARLACRGGLARHGLAACPPGPLALEAARLAVAASPAAAVSPVGSRPGGRVAGWRPCPPQNATTPASTHTQCHPTPATSVLLVRANPAVAIMEAPARRGVDASTRVKASPSASSIVI